MLSILLAGGVALTVTLLGTPLFIRFLVAKQYGQFIRQDGPTSHQIKRGTPTMGGVMIILGTVLGYAFGNGVTGRPPTSRACSSSSSWSGSDSSASSTTRRRYGTGSRSG